MPLESITFNVKYFRCSPKAWEEQISQEAANMRISVSLATENTEREDCESNKEKKMKQ